MGSVEPAGDLAEPCATGNVDLKVLNLAGVELAQLKLPKATSVREIKRQLERELKEKGKPFPVCLQCLCYEDQKLNDASTCESLGWQDATEISIYLTRVSVDIDQCLSVLWNSKGRTKAVDLDMQEVEKLCAVCEDIFQEEAMLLETSGPLTVVGNIHGHFDQLLSIFEQLGSPSKRRYLFLGAYVDKGSRSLDSVVLLLLYKAQQPESILLLRSNHEDAAMSRIYGFYDECRKRSSAKLWKTFIQVFNRMPVCALVNQKIFCVHGGISPELKTLDQIRQLERPSVVPEHGLLCDLLWSDPNRESNGWGENDRGVSYTFGEDVAKQFVKDFGLELLCRSHQCTYDDGYEFFAEETVVTLWSVCRFKGLGEPTTAAVMLVSEDGQRSFHVMRN